MTWAWIPVSRRTPRASYMTIIARMAETANWKLPPPYWIPAAVARAQTVAEWELGIPPLPTSRSASKVLLIRA